MIVATIVCALACAVLVYAEYKRDARLRVIAKVIASLAFMAVGVLACDGAWSPYQRYILIGLAFGVAGDVALLGTSSRAFLAGLAAFLVGHVAYIVAFAQLAPPDSWLDVRGIIPLVVGLTVLRMLWPRLGSMRVPVIGYVIAIVTMMAAAIAAARIAPLPASNRYLLVIGAGLFFASDLAVARDKFVEKSFTNRAWGLPAYYAGQLLIAWSLQ